MWKGDPNLVWIMSYNQPGRQTYINIHAGSLGRGPSKPARQQLNATGPADACAESHIHTMVRKRTRAKDASRSDARLVSTGQSERRKEFAQENSVSIAARMLTGGCIPCAPIYSPKKMHLHSMPSVHRFICLPCSFFTAWAPPACSSAVRVPQSSGEGMLLECAQHGYSGGHQLISHTARPPGGAGSVCFSHTPGLVPETAFPHSLPQCSQGPVSHVNMGRGGHTANTPTRAILSPCLTCMFAYTHAAGKHADTINYNTNLTIKTEAYLNFTSLPGIWADAFQCPIISSSGGLYSSIHHQSF